MKKLAYLTALVTLPFASASLADNYVELAYVDSELSAGGMSADGDGFDLSGEFDVSEMLFVSGAYRTVDFDGIDLDTISVGLGAEGGLGNGASVFGILSYEDIEISGPGGGEGDGFGLEVGLRGEIAQNVSLSGSYTTIEYDGEGGSEADSDYFELGVIFAASDQVGISLAYRTGELEGGGDSIDRDDLSIGLRLAF